MKTIGKISHGTKPHPNELKLTKGKENKKKGMTGKNIEQDNENNRNKENIRNPNEKARN